MGCPPFEKKNNLKKSHDTNIIEYIRFFWKDCSGEVSIPKFLTKGGAFALNF